MEETSIFILTVEETSITKWKFLPFMSKRAVPKMRTKKTSYPLRVPRALGGRMAMGAKKAGLSKGAFMRLSAQRGAEWLARALGATPPPAKRGEEKAI
jgi:hypothetical protein